MHYVRFARALAALALLGPIAVVATPAAAQDTQYIGAGQYIGEGQSNQARAEMIDKFGIAELAPGQFRWADTIPTSGQTRIVISLTDQMGYVYRGDELVGATTVSSGKTDHETPTGVFPIIGKKKVHHSNTYDNAPMPFMQRLNNYGVALHGGNNPGYPASHGCIRLPMKFAARLFELTQTGSPVIIEA